MRSIAIVVFLVMGTPSFAAEPTSFKVRCRKSIHGSFHVDKFDDWSIVTNDMTSELDGVSIDPGPPSGLESSTPDNYMEKGIKAGILKLTNKENWVVCHHSALKIVIEKKVPPGFGTCTVADAGDALSVTCH